MSRAQQLQPSRTEIHNAYINDNFFLKQCNLTTGGGQGEMIALCRKSNSSLYKYFLFTLSQVFENLRVTREKNYCRPLVVIGVRLRTAISLAVAPFSPYNRRRFERLYRYAVRAIINRFRIGNELRCVVRAQIYNSDLFFRKSLRLAFPTCTAVVFLTIFYEFILTETQLFLH